MRSLVVYESWFGNTRRIAEEIETALAEDGEVEIVSVDDPLPSFLRVDLVVLGAPTHVHGLSSERSRTGALDQRGGGGEADFAVFDTRAHGPEFLVGSAAHTMARRLRKRGYRLAVEPESFLVHGTPGPLEDGELERAGEWGKALANEVMSPAA